MSEIRKNIADLAANLKGKVTKDANGNFVVPLDVFKETLPEGLTHETVKKSVTHLQDYGLAVALAAKDDALQHLKDNKGLEKVTIRADLPVGRAVHVVHRDKTGRNPANGEVTHAVGGITSRMQIKLGGTQYRAVNAAYLARAAEIKLD